MESSEKLVKTDNFYFLKELNEEQYRSSLELKKPGPLNIIYKEEEIKPGHTFLEGDFFSTDKDGKSCFLTTFCKLNL